MTAVPEWGPGEAEAELARLQHMEERVLDLALRWQGESLEGAAYAAELRTAVEDRVPGVSG